MQKIGWLFCLICACLCAAGCKAPHIAKGAGEPALYIGITPDYPPLIFRQNKAIAGIEADLARELAQMLDVSIQFVELPWSEQINALLAGKTDIIMSGMTITDARRVRISFSDPWLQLGLMPLVRSKDAEKYGSEEALLNGDANLGVQKGSTADAFVNRRYKGVNSITYLDPNDAPFYLVNRKMDVFIHDAPAVIWMASENEAELAALPRILTKDMIAWGMRKDDTALRRTVNAALARWRKDGTMDRILAKWLPLPPELYNVAP